MAGFEVRGGSSLGQWKYPLYTLWSLADAQGDITTKVRVNNLVRFISKGYSVKPVDYYERWVSRYMHGHQ